MRGLEGRVAVILGAAPGNIGGATAMRLAEEGAVVVAADLNGDAARAVADEITASGAQASAAQCDISSEDSVEALITGAVQRHGSLHTLFNAAADFSPASVAAEGSNDVRTIPIDVWQRTIDVTLTGYMLATRHALPHMIGAGSGSIVNTMSAVVWLAEPVRVAYSAAKAGVAALTRHTATIAGREGVRCNAIAPGAVLSETTRRTLSLEAQERSLEKIPSTRLGTPADIAAAVAFLSSDDGAWINGQTISVDGGLTMR